MIVALDVFYQTEKAKVAGVGFENWTDAEPAAEYVHWHSPVLPYESGAFYKRELPCILGLLGTLEIEKIEILVVDSYVFLDNLGRKGLGAYLFEALDRKIPIIGVAKTYFQGCESFTLPLLRGESRNPLYISSIGLPLSESHGYIGQMAGEHRIPTLLKKVDTLSRV